MPRCRTSVFVNTWSSHFFFDSVHSIVFCVLILLLFNGIFNSINCEKNA